MSGLYGWKPPATIGAKRYLEQRDAEERKQDAQRNAEAYWRSKHWLKEYHTRGRKTAINWSPSITVTKPEETTSEEIHHQEGQAAEVGIAEGVGDAPEECSSDARSSDGNEFGPDEASGGSRFARAGHTADFGDGDTPF